MNIIKSVIKLILPLIFVITFFSSIEAKKYNNFNKGNDISNYFLGTLLLNDNHYSESYKFFKKLDGLEQSHINFLSKYLFSLVNLGKFNEAFHYAKKLEKKNLENFESNLIIGIYYLKNKKYNLAQKYFSNLKNSNGSIINDFISNSIITWAALSNIDLAKAKMKLESMDPKFTNLTNIQNVFLHCYYQNNNTEMYFQKLTSDNKIDFSRYNYFYILYLIDNNKTVEAKKVLESALKIFPRNLLLNQLKLDLKNEIFEKNFDCKNPSHVVSEILYVTANVLSTQQIFAFSNFYLNLSKYLNEDFYSFDILLAENQYKDGNIKQSKKIFNELGKRGEVYSWYAAKQNANILIEEGDNKKAIKNLSYAYEKLSRKTIYEKYDFATFLKNNDRFDKAVKLYSNIIENINPEHPLFAKVTDGRGVCYERLKKWDKAEKDLLSSLKAEPDQAYVINYLAYSWIEQGVKIKQALKMLEKANNLKSNDPFIIDSLGWALFKLERYSDSKSYLLAAVKLMPADPIVNDHYGDVLWKNGKQIQARYYWNYVLNLEETEEDLKKKVRKKLLSGI